MAEAYSNKLRIRIENLVGPKRQVDITSCAFMRDLAKALQQEFKDDMLRLFRARALAQANRDRRSRLEEGKKPAEKPFFRKDSEDEWTPYYSEESDEEKLEGEKEILVEDMSSEPDQIGEFPQLKPSEVQKYEYEPTTDRSYSEVEPSYSLDLIAFEEDAPYIFAPNEVFTRYKSPIVQDMELEQSVDALFEMSENSLSRKISNIDENNSKELNELKAIRNDSDDGNYADDESDYNKSDDFQNKDIKSHDDDEHEKTRSDDQESDHTNINNLESDNNTNEEHESDHGKSDEQKEDIQESDNNDVKTNNVIADDTTKNDTAPEDTIPEDTVAEDTAAEDTVPEVTADTAPEDTIADKTANDETDNSTPADNSTTDATSDEN